MVACILAFPPPGSPTVDPGTYAWVCRGAYAHRVPTLAREPPRREGRKSSRRRSGPSAEMRHPLREHGLPPGKDAFPGDTYQNWSGQPLMHRAATSCPCPTGLAATSRPTTAEGEEIPWLPDVNVSRSSATGFPPSCPTSTRTRPGNGSSRSTTWCAPAAGPAPGTSCCACWSGPVSSRSASLGCAAPTSSTPFPPSANRGSPATSTSSAGSAPTSGGTPPSWCPLVEGLLREAFRRISALAIIVAILLGSSWYITCWVGQEYGFLTRQIGT